MANNMRWLTTAKLLLIMLPLVAKASPSTVPALAYAIPENGYMMIIAEVSERGDYRLQAQGGSSHNRKWYAKDSVALVDRTLCRESDKCINSIVIDATGANLTIGGFFLNGDYAVSPLGKGIFRRHDGKGLAVTTTGLKTKRNFVVGDFVRNDRGQYFRISGAYQGGDMALREMEPMVFRSTPTSEVDFASANCGRALGPTLRVCVPFNSNNGEPWIIEGVYANGDLLIRKLYSLVGYAHRVTRDAFQAQFNDITLD